MLITLNAINGADVIINRFAKHCLTDFDGKLYGAVLGIAYGGDVESIAKIWKNRGIVYGYDTFSDLHPGHLAGDPDGFEGTCMSHWYEMHGTDKLKIEYQRACLDKLLLDNAILVKGEVTKHSCKDIPYLNFAFLDMDILASMRTGYKAVVNKIVKGGYLFLHDIPNIGSLTKWYNEEVKPDKRFEQIIADGRGVLTGLKRI